MFQNHISLMIVDEAIRSGSDKFINMPYPIVASQGAFKF